MRSGMRELPVRMAQGEGEQVGWFKIRHAYPPIPMQQHVKKLGWAVAYYGGIETHPNFRPLKKQCHLVSLGDVKARPPYCENPDGIGCPCCQHCCTCGG